jgi:Tfp pilus assembly protein PilN
MQMSCNKSSSSPSIADQCGTNDLPPKIMLQQLNAKSGAMTGGGISLAGLAASTL